MIEMEEQWIDKLRERFADRATPPPDGLWADIEAAMRAKRKRVLLSPLAFRRAAAVAACVAVVVGAGWMLFSHDSQVVLPSALNGGSSDAPVAASGIRPRGQVVSEVRKLFYGGREAMVAKTDVMCDRVALSSVLDDEIVAGDVADTAAVGGKQVNEGGRPALRMDLPDGDGHSRTADVMLASSSRSSGRHTGGLSVGVYGAGLTSLGGGSGMGGETFMPFNLREGSMPYKNAMVLSASGDNSSEVNVKHRQPVKVGASVRLKLSRRLGLETGLNYSYHSSDIASGDEEAGYKTEQKLHFMGVPLGVSYSVWGNDHLDVYVSAGGEVEFCVSGKSHTEYVSDGAVVRTADETLRDSRPQWSVNAAAGVQYSFNDVVGIYAEPGVSYFFDNGSDVCTIYKDKPLNFNLDVGLRFTIK